MQENNNNTARTLKDKVFRLFGFKRKEVIRVHLENLVNTYGLEETLAALKSIDIVADSETTIKLYSKKIRSNIHGK